MNAEHEDPVVTEIRAVRHELTERFGDDIEALCDFLAEQEREHEDRLVNRPPKVPQVAAIAEGQIT
jgi:hypothetical protein